MIVIPSVARDDTAALGGLPVVETIPAELVRRADLVRKAERIHPALLLRTPATVPGELDDTRVSATVDRHGPNEVGAARARVNSQPINDPFRVRVQQLIDQSDDLDARDVADERDRGRFGASSERDHIGLEAFGGAGVREDLGIYWHGRNISGATGILGGVRTRKQTNLTNESTPLPFGEVGRW